MATSYARTGPVVPRHDEEPVAPATQSDVRELRETLDQHGLRRVRHVPDHHAAPPCVLVARHEPMQLGGHATPVGTEDHVDMVLRRVGHSHVPADPARLPRRRRPGRGVVEPQGRAERSARDGEKVLPGRERDRGTLGGSRRERQGLQSVGVEELRAALPQATREKRAVRAGGDGREVSRAGGADLPPQVVHACECPCPRQHRPEVLPGLGRLVQPDALRREEQTSREVLVQGPLGSGPPRVRKDQRCSRPVALLLGASPLVVARGRRTGRPRVRRRAPGPGPGRRRRGRSSGVC